jgi:outer membrane protein assembly factor BamB
MCRTLNVLFFIAGTAMAQDSFLDTPTRKWQVTVPPMGEGNGIVMETDDRAVFATSSDGTITALDPDDGSKNWDFQPPAGNGTVPLSSNGQVAISQDKKFMVYSVTEDADSENAICKVVALGNPAGELLWISDRLEGECAGTPVISSDGRLVFLTHNSNQGTYGHFSIVSAQGMGRALFSRANTVAPYSPPGYVWNPTLGNFEDNENNQRDVIIWSYAPTPDATEVGPGRTFAFQLNSDFNNNTSDFSVDVLSPEVDWQATTAPLIAANGLRLYWSVSRSKLRAWIRSTNSTGATNSTGSTNSTGNDGKFDQERTGGFDFARGDPSSLAGFSTPQVDDLENPTILCVAGASTEFYCLDATSLAEEWMVSTASLIKTEARFSTKGDRVYFITEDGVIFSYNARGSATRNWEEDVGNKVLSNFDLSSDGGFLYCGDETGQVSAYQLSSSTLPPVTPVTREPSAAPSMSSPSSPTASGAPNFPTNRPTPAPAVPSGASSMVMSSVLGVASLVALAFVL